MQAMIGNSRDFDSVMACNTLLLKCTRSCAQACLKSVSTSSMADSVKSDAEGKVVTLVNLLAVAMVRHVTAFLQGVKKGLQARKLSV